MDRCMSACCPYETEYRVVWPDGSVHWLAARGVFQYDAQGNALRLLGIHMDITDRKAAEEALRQVNVELERRVTERTAELSRTVEALRDEVARRTLAEKTLRRRSEQLRALTSELTLAEQRERRRLAEVLHDNLQQILVATKFQLTPLERSGDEGVRQAAAKIDDLLDQSIAVSRGLTGELSPPILHEGGLVAALEWLARWMLDKHGLAVGLDVRGKVGELPEDITVLLFQSARELLFNVVKHARTVAARVHLDRTNDSLCLTVADEGAGFDPADLEDRGERQGGLGLFSIRERVGLLGGSMDIDAAPGRGSRFTLAVPVAPPEEAPPAQHKPIVSVAIPGPPGAERVAAGAVRVVLVDDHIVTRQGLAMLLEDQPDMAVVGQASDGESAIELVRQMRPDVVVMDASMPGMGGVEATRAIHAEMPEVKVVGLSMFEEADIGAAMRQAGAVDYLAKSGHAKSVIASVRTYGRGKTAGAATGRKGTAKGPTAGKAKAGAKATRAGAKAKARPAGAKAAKNKAARKPKRR